MIQIQDIDVWGFEHAVYGMRNPMNSWDKSDSEWKRVENLSLINPNNPGMMFVIGQKDLDLMRKLYRAGVEHRTFARFIQVSMNIIAPLYFWKECDRYTIGKSQISTSTMHKIHEKEFTPDDFSHEHLENFDGYSNTAQFHEWFIDTIDKLNVARRLYLDTGDKRYWWQMIQLLPSSYNQRRTVLMSYEVVFKIIKERTGHKLDEWNGFVEILKNELPYLKEIMRGEE